MDIDEALRRMRIMVMTAQSAIDDRSSEAPILTQGVLTQWQAIDEWLSHGGFLPTAWQR